MKWSCFMLLALPAWASAALVAYMDRNEITLGEPVTATVSSDLAKPSLDDLKLNALQADFDIYRRSSDTRTQAIGGRLITSQTMTLVLYPLHDGRVLFPALHWGGASSLPLALRVRASGADVPHVQFKLTLQPGRLFVRQSARLVLDIYDDGSLQWSPLWLPPPAGVHVRELAPSQREEVVKGVPLTVHRRSWAIMPLRAGTSEVKLPMLEALKFGERLRYVLPSLQFDTLPAPAYLPVYVPLGKLEVSSHPPVGTLVLNRPVNWTLVVQGAGLSAEGLAKLLPSFADTDAIHFYPAQIDPLGEAGTLVQTWRVLLPFKPLRAGNMQLPALTLPYYDPAHNRLESVVIRSAVLMVVNPLWHEFARSVLIAGILIALAWLTYIGWQGYRRWLARHGSLRKLEAAINCAELSQALLNFDWGMGRLRVVTLTQWLQAMTLRNGENAALRQLVLQLQVCCYGVVSETEVNYLRLHESARKLMRVPGRNKKRSAWLRFHMHSN
ncbi:MAG: BatD family protein [Sulfuriferula sp.]